MNGIFGNLAFLNPWALAALLALPALYWLLRITPPAPRLVHFPAARFLLDLQPKKTTPSHTPWWILLLRLLMAALLLLALARPVLNPSSALPTQGPLRLVIDNGWAAAQNWNDITQSAVALIDQAGRDEQEIFIITTNGETTQAGATPSGGQIEGPLTASDAKARLKALKPYPWEPDIKMLNALIKEGQPGFSGLSVWLSDGIAKKNVDELSASLKQSGSFLFYQPKDKDLPFFLKASLKPISKPEIILDGPRNRDFTAPVKIQLQGTQGDILDEQTLQNFKFPAEASFDVPEMLRVKTAQFRISLMQGAQTLYILDAQGGPKNIGIIAPEQTAETKPLIEDSFYLQKALEPYANLQIGTADEILKAAPAMMVLPDIGAMPADTLNRLDQWVRDGGLLLRFAGPNMTQNAGKTTLSPVPLRQNSRALQGSLSWEKPQKLLPFKPESPLYGLDLHEDITVRQQILPEPTADLPDKTWAALEDGTPLITGTDYGDGLLVMIHTTASPIWSDLPLSGLYVDILKRLIKLAGRPIYLNAPSEGLLQPVSIMDGFGALQAPGPDIKPIDAAQIDNVILGPQTPPGLYGQGGLQRAINLGDHLDKVTAMDPPPGATLKTYGGDSEHDLFPSLLLAAFALFILDALIMAAMSFGLKTIRASSLIIALLVFALPQSAHAEDVSPYAQDLYLAYIKTGNAAIDAQSQRGLEVLAKVLNSRTSAEPAGVTGLDPAQDTMAFFPLIYWPVSTAQQTPSTEALQNLQDYLDHGGTLLIDARNGKGDPQELQRLIGGLNIPPLIPLPEDHVLGKSFYLLDYFPGRYDGDTLWIEEQSTSGRDGVSSVIIGSHDWAGAWAEMIVFQRNGQNYVSTTTERQEMSLRFGVNLVIYALTGNYKADQVHVPHILERLGQ